MSSPKKHFTVYSRKKLGQTIKRLRIQRGLTQIEMVEQINRRYPRSFTNGILSAIECGTKGQSISRLVAICEVLFGDKAYEGLALLIQSARGEQ